MGVSARKEGNAEDGGRQSQIREEIEVARELGE